MAWTTNNANMHFAGGVSGQSDGSWEQAQREAGSYQPGSMEHMTDQIEQGSDEQA
jgi:hypothetical protein